MPTEHRIYPDQKLVIVTCSGRLTLNEIVVDNLAYFADPDMRFDQNVFIDMSRVTDFPITFRGLLSLFKAFVMPVDQFEATRMTAIYAPTDITFARGSQFQRISSASSKICVGVFREPNAAWQFVGLADPASAPLFGGS
ncbi:hypothetical protein [Shimia ponticola]|uniref:hypothetical protein n=1 Tax=Shimia ponticola TaxID=2582893 RepID=UPI0011BE5A53|nr:hypothetical protein [Shimia ponticola]